MNLLSFSNLFYLSVGFFMWFVSPVQSMTSDIWFHLKIHQEEEDWKNNTWCPQLYIYEEILILGKLDLILVEFFYLTFFIKWIWAVFWIAEVCLIISVAKDQWLGAFSEVSCETVGYLTGLLNNSISFSGSCLFIFLLLSCCYKLETADCIYII